MSSVRRGSGPFPGSAFGLQPNRTPGLPPGNDITLTNGIGTPAQRIRIPFFGRQQLEERSPMEALAQMVAASMARHGVHPAPVERRLQWSGWVRCESSLSMLLAPSQPGIYALAEEVLAPGETSAVGGRRMLAVLDVRQASDLGLEMGRLFAPASPWLDRLRNGRCFVRYAIVEDAADRQAAHLALGQWLAGSAEKISGLSADFPLEPGSTPYVVKPSQVAASGPGPLAQIGTPAPLPSGF
jgi:hypothetical protein